MPMFKFATGNCIKSKSQMRAMFASNPHKAKLLADKQRGLKRLPEKKGTKTIPPAHYDEVLKKSSFDLIKEAVAGVQPGQFIPGSPDARSATAFAQAQRDPFFRLGNNNPANQKPANPIPTNPAFTNGRIMNQIKR